MKKEKFSLEEIYLNKNFRTPTEKKWETIFEFPKENKDGSVRCVVIYIGCILEMRCSAL